MVGIFMQDIIHSIYIKILRRKIFFKWQSASLRFISAEFAANVYRKPYVILFVRKPINYICEHSSWTIYARESLAT